MDTLYVSETEVDKEALCNLFWKNLFVNMRASQRLRSQWRLKFASHIFLKQNCSDSAQVQANNFGRVRALDCKTCQILELLDTFLTLHAPLLLSGRFQARHWHPEAPTCPHATGDCDCAHTSRYDEHSPTSRTSSEWSALPSPVQYNRNIGDMLCSSSPFMFINSYYHNHLGMEHYKLRLHPDLLSDANAVFPVRPVPRDHESLANLTSAGVRQAVTSFREQAQPTADRFGTRTTTTGIPGRMGALRNAVSTSAFSVPTSNLTHTTLPGRKCPQRCDVNSSTDRRAFVQLCPWLPVVNIPQFRCHRGPTGVSCICGTSDYTVDTSSSSSGNRCNTGPRGSSNNTPVLAVDYFTARDGHFLDSHMLQYTEDLARSVASGFDESCVGLTGPEAHASKGKDDSATGLKTVWSGLKRACANIATKFRGGRPEHPQQCDDIVMSSNPAMTPNTTPLPDECIHYFHTIIAGVDESTPPPASERVSAGFAGVLKHYRELELPVREVVVAINMFVPPTKTNDVHLAREIPRRRATSSTGRYSPSTQESEHEGEYMAYTGGADRGEGEYMAYTGGADRGEYDTYTVIPKDQYTCMSPPTPPPAPPPIMLYSPQSPVVNGTRNQRMVSVEAPDSAPIIAKCSAISFRYKL